MMDENVTTDREFEERTKRLFDESVAALDGEIRSKLTQARYRALEELESPRQLAWMRSLLPAGAVAAVAMLTVMLWQGQVQPLDETSFDVAAVTDIEILLGDEELDMIEQLEFYAWLEEQVEATEGRIVEDGIG
ncbi:MAG TPA: hypothetical protein VIV14_11275 [Gammaproteobacteria bacterium]